jgi:cell wall-associated NlpC family hydrolase
MVACGGWAFAAPSPSPSASPSPAATAVTSPLASGLAAQAHALKALAADLAEAQQTLAPLQATATTATKTWRQTLAKLSVARAAQARADSTAAVARAATDAQDETVGQMAASAYKSGGDTPSWMTALNVNNPTDLFTQQATLNQIADNQATQLAQLQQLQTVADGAAQAAGGAAGHVFALVDEARRAHDAASAAMGAQQKVVHELFIRQARISDAVQKLLAKTPAVQRVPLLRQLADALKAVDATAADVDASMQTVTALLPVATAHQGLDALARAKKQLGVPYSWGGGTETGPTLGTVNPDGNSAGLTTTGFDCSGLTLFAWAKEGFALDHYTGFQWFEGRPVARADLRPGDLVFYATDPKDETTIHHVGIYAGNGRMIDAPHTGAKVRYDDVFSAQYVGAVRP